MNLDHYQLIFVVAVAVVLMLLMISLKCSFSNNIISSASKIELNSIKLLLNKLILGINEQTICDHALYKLSSHIEVGKPINLK